ncbi:MAG: dipeptidase [Chloroflexi bacterium]|nr:dipeptidase [Chloroflexota bacterium]
MAEQTSTDPRLENYRAFHESLLVGNMHADYSFEVAKAHEQRNEHAILERTYLPKLKEGGVDFEFYTVGGDTSNFSGMDDLTLGTFRRIDLAYTEVEESPSFALVTSTAELLRAHEQGKRALLMTIEGAAPVREDLYLVRDMYRLGLRSICLCWFKGNPSGDGVGETRNGGLSNFGRSLIKEMNRLGMVVDISQCGPATVSDVLDISEQPIIASHSNASGQYSHRRNPTDREIERIAKGGGLVCVTSFPAHVSGDSPNIDKFMDHIEYIVKLVGVDHVAMGLNIIVHSEQFAADFFKKGNIEFSSMWLSGLEDVNLVPEVTRRLIQRGYSDGDIAKIMGGNSLRLLRQVIG